jgi:predicted dehydrogenase
MADPFKVAVIGTGGRSVSYTRVYATCPDIDVVALADPVPEHRKAMSKRANLPGGAAEFDDWREMLDAHTDLDGVVIASPNDAHADQAVACFERGLPIALEKPLATTQADCERIIDAERANNGRSLIGFVLRSSPFYSRIFELLSSGAIGQIVSIQADELPGWGVSSIMNRSPWRRFDKSSGGALLEKCCHDMDVLNWMMGCRPVSLASFGDTLIFRPNPALPAVCDECGVGDTCKYYKKPVFSKHEDEGEEILHQFIREDNRCIYNIDKDGVDTQSVTIRYENGALANFMMTFNCAGPKASRNFHAVGHKGRVWGNLHDNTVYHYDNTTGETAEFDTTGDGSGHGGGDRLHALQLLSMMQDPEYRPAQNAYTGYLSAVMCFAADRSRRESTCIDFHYSGDGYVKLVPAGR